MSAYLEVENSEGLFNLLNQFNGEELSVKKDVGGAMALVEPDTGDIVAYVSDGRLGDEPRQPDEALADAEKHLGEVINALQDAGWTNAELQTVERLIQDVKGQNGGDD